MSVETQQRPNLYPHTPDYAIPIAPGEHLKEKLDEMGITSKQFSEESGLPVEAVGLFFCRQAPGNVVLGDEIGEDH